MTKGIEFIEGIYGQLRELDLVQTKGEFSQRLLGRSPSYLTAMRAKQRYVSSSVIAALETNLLAEVRRTKKNAEPGGQAVNARLREIWASVELFQEDQFQREAERARFAFGAAHCADLKARGIEPDYFAPILHLPPVVYWLIRRIWTQSKL